MSVAALTKKILHAALFYEIWDAMKVTFRHMFHRPMTFQYPREQRTIPDAHRGALGLLRYDDGQERCVGCDLCEVACPSHCIKVISAEDTSRPLQRYRQRILYRYHEMRLLRVLCGGLSGQRAGDDQNVRIFHPRQAKFAVRQETVVRHRRTPSR